MKTVRFLSILILFAFYAVNPVSAAISLPAIFSDNMVLQQKSEVKIWGWAKTMEKITLKAGWLDKEISTVADNQGKWFIVLSTPSAGGPYEMTLSGFNEITIRNILIGEVWLCSGQSNMEWSAKSGINNPDEEIKDANIKGVRLFTVYHSTALYPQELLTGKWVECTPETMQSFSAIGYFFARNLNARGGFPVGIINSSWGGTPAESWMPEEAIMNDEILRDAASKQKPVPWGPVETARIYNSMIHPLIPFRIAGVLWYQGEANTINGYAYRELLTALIKSWREKWGYDFPFYYAQIAPYKYSNPYEGVIVRDAQRRVLDVAGTGMVVLSDIGDTTNIHPKNKQDAAARFANLALARTYKMTGITDMGPVYRTMTIEKNKAIISFDYSDGLHASGDRITCFEIAGADKVFYPATARIKDNKVIVQSDKVKVPVAVRFAWSNTATPNLFNGANLPASCFTTE